MQQSCWDEERTLLAVAILRNAVADTAKDVDAPHLETLARRVHAEFDRIAHNEEDYEFKVKRCVRCFVADYMRARKHLAMNKELEKTVATSVRLCCDWFGADEYTSDEQYRTFISEITGADGY